MDLAMFSPMDHFKTIRRRSPSLPWRPVALVPTARFCGLIILPRTPPEELAPTVRLGFNPSCWAVTFWRLANSALEEVRARQRHPEPPDEGREEWEKDARGRGRQAEGKGHACVVEQEPEPQHGDYGEDGPLELVDRL